MGSQRVGLKWAAELNWTGRNMINALQPKQKWKNRESIWKTVQNNDSKDDQKSWKQNGVTDKETRNKDWEDARNI